MGGGQVSLWNCFWRNCFWPLTLLILLGLLQMFWPGGEWRKIENDVSTTVASNLKENGIEWAQVDTNDRGRDVLLSGSAPSEEAKSTAIRIAEELSQDKRGNPVARIVEWQGDIVEPVVESQPDIVEPVAEPQPVIVEPEPEPEPVVELQPGKLSFTAVDGKITLNGVIANEDQKRALVVAANKTYGSANVIDRLSFGENILPIAQIGSLVSDFALPDGTLRVSLEKGLKITGEVDSEERKLSIGQNLQNALGSDYSVKNLLSVRVPEPEPEPEPEPIIVQEPIVDTAAICQAQVQELMSNSKIFFETSKAEIKSESYTLLDNIAAVLAECSESAVEISGHTDSTGSQAINQPLSLNRAKAVVDYLISKGVDANRLASEGFGAEKPIADNSTKEGRATNRRIEFTVK